MPEQKAKEPGVLKASAKSSAQNDELKELKKTVELLKLQLENQQRMANKEAIVPEDGSRQRFYSNKGEVDHDLFKLKVESMMKNVSWTKEEPDYRPVEHCHMFHTIDSSGKPQKYSTAQGGHFHEMEVVYKDGVPEVVCKSGPLEWVWIKRGKRRIKVARPIFDGLFRDFDSENPKIPVDVHKHEVQYIKSDRIALRRINEEAQVLIAKNAALTTKPKDLDLG